MKNNELSWTTIAAGAGLFSILGVVYAIWHYTRSKDEPKNETNYTTPKKTGSQNYTLPPNLGDQQGSQMVPYSEQTSPNLTINNFNNIKNAQLNIDNLPEKIKLQVNAFVSSEVERLEAFCELKLNECILKLNKGLSIEAKILIAAQEKKIKLLEEKHGKIINDLLKYIVELDLEQCAMAAVMHTINKKTQGVAVSDNGEAKLMDHLQSEVLENAIYFAMEYKLPITDELIALSLSGETSGAGESDVS